MNVFVSETCYRQVFGTKKGSSLRRIDDFNRLVGRLQEAGSRADLQVKGLGTKKYRSMGGRDIYGIDLNNGLTAERVVFRFVEPDDEEAAAKFGRYGDAGQAETVLLCYCSEHDSQHRHARQVAEATSKGLAPDIAMTLPDAAVAELARVEANEVPWRTYAEGDLERYGRPRTPVLTEDKFRIVGDFLASDGPMLVTGAAGSGKTELGLRILHDFVRSRIAEGVEPPRVLYVTFSQRLLAEVESRVGSEVRASCDFMTFDTVLRSRHADPDLRFANARVFSSFISALEARPAMGGPDRSRMLRLVEARGQGCVYAEVYGVIFGSMGHLWDRWPASGGEPASPLLSEEAYLALPDAQCGLTSRADRMVAYRIAQAFWRWICAARLGERSQSSISLATAVEKPSYDLVIADEVQDLTEVQVELLARLAGGVPGSGPCRLFMTGDVNQVLTPTAFDARRFLRLGRGLRVERLMGNFRNPEAVCEVANAVATVRQESLRLPARRAGEAHAERAFNRSAGRTLWCISSDEELLCQLVDEAANIALVCDPATYRRLRPSCSSVFTVEQVKGMEFDNVVLYGVLSAEQERFDAVLSPGPKDASLHRPLNRLYVGLTRSCGSLLVVEPRGGQMLARLVALDAHFEHVADPLDVDFDLDASAYGYLQVALTLKEQGAYAQARANFERSLAVSDRCSRLPQAPGMPVVADEPLSAGEEEEARRQMAICSIYLEYGESATEGELVEAFERAGYYEEALPHAKAALDERRCALLTLAADRGADGARFSVSDRLDAFEHVTLRLGLDLPDLWGVTDEYDRLLMWYVGERADDLELLAMETTELATHVASVLRGLPAGRPNGAGAGLPTW